MIGLGGDSEAAGGAACADCDRDGVGEAGREEVLGWCVEVVDRVCGLGAGQAAPRAESEDRVGEAGALLWGVDLVGNRAQFVPASIRIVVSDSVPKSLQLWRDEFWELDV